MDDGFSRSTVADNENNKAERGIKQQRRRADGMIRGVRCVKKNEAKDTPFETHYSEDRSLPFPLRPSPEYNILLYVQVLLPSTCTKL